MPFPALLNFLLNIALFLNYHIRVNDFGSTKTFGLYNFQIYRYFSPIIVKKLIRFILIN